MGTLSQDSTNTKLGTQNKEACLNNMERNVTRNLKMQNIIRIALIC